MENKQYETKSVPVHFFKVVEKNGDLKTHAYVDVEDFKRVMKERQPAEIVDVIFNPPATIVFWSDGTKTVVKVENELFDKEKGLAMAICKKTGGGGRYYNVFRHYCHEEHSEATGFASLEKAAREWYDGMADAAKRIFGTVSPSKNTSGYEEMSNKEKD